MTEFEQIVLRWVQTRDASAAEIISVEGNGTDWAGSTEGGFYDRFSADIYYSRADQSTAWVEATGETMASLWAFIVSAVDESKVAP